MKTTIAVCLAGLAMAILAYTLLRALQRQPADQTEIAQTAGLVQAIFWVGTVIFLLGGIQVFFRIGTVIFAPGGKSAITSPGPRLRSGSVSHQPQSVPRSPLRGQIPARRKVLLAQGSLSNVRDRFGTKLPYGQRRLLEFKPDQTYFTVIDVELFGGDRVPSSSLGFIPRGTKLTVASILNEDWIRVGTEHGDLGFVRKADLRANGAENGKTV